MKYRLLVLLMVFSTQLFANSPITICTDTNFWYPFTFVKNQQATGLHIDIIETAFDNLHLQPLFKTATWSECLDQAKMGTVDAVATASFQPERTAFLLYPKDAENPQSDWRVTQVEYKVITPATRNNQPNTYIFEGDVTTLPEPVRAPKDYSIVKDLERSSLKVEPGQTSLDNLRSLVKDQSGSMVDLSETIEYLSTNPEFSEQVIIQKRPLNRKSYFLAFSKQGSVSESQAEQIWNEIAVVRNNTGLMAEFLKKY